LLGPKNINAMTKMISSSGTPSFPPNIVLLRPGNALKQASVGLLLDSRRL
jgi:hypothetical protein